jgi:hypothetical protein
MNSILHVLITLLRQKNCWREGGETEREGGETERGGAERRRGGLATDIRASRDWILIIMKSKPDLIIISPGKVRAGESENNQLCCREMS